MSWFSNWWKSYKAAKRLRPKPRAPVRSKNHGDFKSGRWVYRRQWYSFRRRHPESYCAKRQKAQLVRGGYADLKRVEAVLRKQCIPTNDLGDVWDSHLIEYKKGRRWKGDCEDFAITGIDVMLFNGYVSPASCTLHIVDQHGGRKSNHMVGSIKIDGRTYLIDILRRNKVVKIIRIEDCKYTFISHMRVQTPGRWRKTVM